MYALSKVNKNALRAACLKEIRAIKKDRERFVQNEIDRRTRSHNFWLPFMGFLLADVNTEPPEWTRYWRKIDEEKLEAMISLAENCVEENMWLSEEGVSLSGLNTQGRT